MIPFGAHRGRHAKASSLKTGNNEAWTEESLPLEYAWQIRRNALTRLKIVVFDDIRHGILCLNFICSLADAALFSLYLDSSELKLLVLAAQELV